MLLDTFLLNALCLPSEAPAVEEAENQSGCKEKRINNQQDQQSELNCITESARRAATRRKKTSDVLFQENVNNVTKSPNIERSAVRGVTLHFATSRLQHKVHLLVASHTRMLISDKLGCFAS